MRPAPASGHAARDTGAVGLRQIAAGAVAMGVHLRELRPEQENLRGVKYTHTSTRGSPSLAAP